MPRLLVVDDRPSVCEFIHEYFSSKGYDVIAAATGMEGLRRLREERPHLVLLDVMLPDLSGLLVLREAKRIDPTVGIVMVTGVQDEGLRREARRVGAFDFITKPVDLKQLEQVLLCKLTTMMLG